VELDIVGWVKRKRQRILPVVLQADGDYHSSFGSGMIG
jgi:hypothetical protein